ncbi:MAG: YegP family protein [Phascolarctobacterium sp.]|nr:YegP family protein [Phascolarctobacterium sp.]
MGKFVISPTKNGGVKFNLKAGNGEIIAVSQVYKDEKYCRQGIASVMKNAPIAEIEDQTVEGFEKVKHPKFEVYKDKAGEFRFRLKATNGQIIATGEGYKALASCKNGIASIKKNAPDAKIVVEEEK